MYRSKVVPFTLFFSIPIVPSGNKTMMTMIIGAKISNWNPGKIMAR
jgi:hypothetical protein